MRRLLMIPVALVLVTLVLLPVGGCSTESTESTESGTSEPGCIYSEDFSDSENSWGWIEGDPEVQAGPSDGVYRVTGTWFGQVSMAQQGGKGKAPRFPNDFILEADVQFVGEAEQAPLGLWWQNQLQFDFRQVTRQKEAGDLYYTFCISSDGYTWIDREECVSNGDGTLTTSRVKIMEPQKISSFRSQDFNHFRLEAIGGTLAVYVNDEAAFTLDEPYEPSGPQCWIYILAQASCIDETGWGWSQKPYEILIDNVNAYLP